MAREGAGLTVARVTGGRKAPGSVQPAVYDVEKNSSNIERIGINCVGTKCM